jgi:hypothetical protein
VNKTGCINEWNREFAKKLTKCCSVHHGDVIAIVVVVHAFTGIRKPWRELWGSQKGR